MRIHGLENELGAELGESPTCGRAGRRRVAEPRGGARARAAYRALHASSLDTKTHEDGDETLSLIDTLGMTETGYSSVLDRTALESLMGELEERDRAIVQLYFREELTQAQIGERLGYSQMHISRLLRRAVRELEQAAA